MRQTATNGCIGSSDPGILVPNPHNTVFIPRIDILAQPDDTTCGPTCLHAVYRFFQDDIPLGQLISDIEPLPLGGTMAVGLACHALARGYRATIYTYNLHLFDPTWFAAAPEEMPQRLRAQLAVKGMDYKLAKATDDYLKFFERGGQLRHEELDRALLGRLLSHGRPVLTGLSATYLYNCARERAIDNEYDDIAGVPSGHFVVLCDYNRETDSVDVADPLLDNPLYSTHHYRVGVDRLLGAILLGIVTYDANLLVIEPG